jgi:hypothetical protein
LLIEEKQRGKGLVLSGGGDMFFDGQTGQKGGNFPFAHVVRVALLMEENETPNPVDIGLLGAQAVMFHPQMPANAIQ